MKRALAIAAAAAVLAAPTAASAAVRAYDGKIKGDAEATVTLKVAGKRDSREVRFFGTENLLIECEGGEQARLKSATITGEAAVDEDDRFAIKGTSGGQRFKVAGKLKGKRAAKGTVRYSGPTNVDGSQLDCDSGKLGWKASR